jgi:hypothetical protein
LVINFTVITKKKSSLHSKPMNQKNIPCDFVFDYLMPLEVTVKPMFGVWAIYVDKKIMLVLKQRKDSPENKRRMDCPPRSITKFKKGVAFVMLISNNSNRLKETEWQLLPDDTDEFEVSARKACDLIKRNDHRIGRIPLPRQKEKK